MAIIILIVTLLLAYYNGSNDNFKGVSTLFGSGTTKYSTAINWATGTTLLGSITSIFIAQTLVKNFSGKGLVTDTLVNNPNFITAVALGAAITLMIATKFGMPISTTHSLIGALTGAGIIELGSSFNYSKLGNTFFLPLIISPLIGFILSYLLYYLFSGLRRYFGINKTSCLCLIESHEIHVCNSGVLAMNTELTLKTNKFGDCSARYLGTFLGVPSQKIIDVLHFVSAGAVSFARGLNDTPKMAGLLLVISGFNIKFGLLAIAIAIALGA